MAWEVEYTDQFERWWRTLTIEEQDRVDMGVMMIATEGPALGRPWVDSLAGSKHSNMKELRPRGGHLRVLFAFDPRRAAILLLGGDKTGQWSAWYQSAIPAADQLYDDHLKELRDEGIIE